MTTKFAPTPVTGPQAPVRKSSKQLALRAWCTFVMAATIAGMSWIKAIGELGSLIVAIVVIVGSIVAWVLNKPKVQWSRLPWFAIGYVAWAGLSITWSKWPSVSLVTWVLLVATTFVGLFLALVLNWRAIFSCLVSAVKWIIGLSFIFELGVAIFVGGPILPGFVLPQEDMHWVEHWSSGELFGDERIQGIFGNANPIGAASLLAVVVLSVSFAATKRGRVSTGVWILLSAYLLYRSASATAFIAAIAVAITVIAVLVMRTVRDPHKRTGWYLSFGAMGVILLSSAWVWRNEIFMALGRSSTFTGRDRIWAEVIQRGNESPLVGNGIATPWMPWDPHFNGWIIDMDQNVLQAHNMWIDVYMQLGLIGVFLLFILFLAFIWRSWFFAIDRPQWDLNTNRPYSAWTLLPIMIGILLTVQGLTESSPLMLWGWMFIVMFAAKIKQSPNVGVGPAEQRRLIESGSLMHARPRLDYPDRLQTSAGSQN